MTPTRCSRPCARWLLLCLAPLLACPLRLSHLRESCRNLGARHCFPALDTANLRLDLRLVDLRLVDKWFPSNSTSETHAQICADCMRTARQLWLCMCQCGCRAARGRQVGLALPLSLACCREIGVATPLPRAHAGALATTLPLGHGASGARGLPRGWPRAACWAGRCAGASARGAQGRSRGTHSWRIGSVVGQGVSGRCLAGAVVERRRG